VSAVYDSVDGSPIKQSLLPEALEKLLGSELPAPAPEIMEKKDLTPPLSNTEIQREVVISAPSDYTEDPHLPSAEQVAVVSENLPIQAFPTAQTKTDEIKENGSNGEEENPGILQGFRDAGILNIPSFDEALALWKQLEPRFKERAIGDILAENLGLDNIQPNPAQVSQLQAWLRHFISIHETKVAISRLQSDIGTRESRMKSTNVDYPKVVYEEREKITDIGLEGSVGLKGNILLHEYTENSSGSAPMLVYRWTSFKGMDAKEDGRKIDVETRCGDLIPRLFGREWERYR
jgi:hypothetical protein